MDDLSAGHVAGRIEGLEQQAVTDRETIQELQERAAVDQALIRHLEAEGEIDRQKIANLETALGTARRIGAAIGVLMVRQQLTDAAAFELLRDVSHDSHRKLRDIADEVVLTGALPQAGSRG